MKDNMDMAVALGTLLMMRRYKKHGHGNNNFVHKLKLPVSNPYPYKARQEAWTSVILCALDREGQHI